ncbi:MAG: molybdopterin cofactor-binding domain-containing protein, partial [Verrucomicrobiales bacterium]
MRRGRRTSRGNVGARPRHARHPGRPPTGDETRTENLTAQAQGRGHSHQVAIGGTRDGRILALELDIRADAGAYPLLGAYLPHFTRLM